MKIIYLLIASTTIVSGCANSPRAHLLSSDFDAATAQRLVAPGTGAVKGSALIRQQGGGVVTCAGNSVWLVPVTSYATERINALYVNGERGYNPAGFSGRKPMFSPDIPDYQRLRREARCDAQGFFRFDEVAEGNFYVITAIMWQVNQYMPEGGSLMQLVRVGPKANVDIVLTP